MPCHTRDICMVSLYCEYCCVQQAVQPLWIVCHNHYIQMVSLQNDFTCKCWLLLKLFPHSVHLYLLLWTFICDLILRSFGKRFSHWIHEYISPVSVCNFLWTVKLVLSENRLSHTVHTNGFSPLWSRLWRFKFLLCVNRLSHTVHKYGLSLSSCGCSVVSLLSASIFTSVKRPVQ